MSQDQLPTFLDDINLFTADAAGDDAHLTFDPDQLEFAFLDAQTPLEPPAGNYSNHEFAHSSTSLPVSFGHDSDTDSLQASLPLADAVPEALEAEWELGAMNLGRPHSAGPEVSLNIQRRSYPSANSTISSHQPVLPETDIHTDLQGRNEHAAVPRSGSTGLPRRRSRYLVRTLGAQTSPIVIPNSSAMGPMERWRESPPEDEPAAMFAILRALENTPAGQADQSRVGSSNIRTTGQHNAFNQHRRAPSTASGESSGSSRTSRDSILSHSPSRSQSASGRTSRVRVNKYTRENGSTGKARKFCCTFCCDTFKNKYDWARHERSLHLNLEKWYCAPHGTSVFSTVTHRKHCAFCNLLDPTPEHLNQHHPKACQDDSGEPRSFHRKDHLMQHLRQVHNVNILPLIEDWKIGTSAVSSRCGFCDQNFGTWEQRVSHLADHFRKGSTMKDWRGEHGFSPAIAAQVTNSLPPYLIGSESQSIIPFSATNTHVRDHFAQISSRAQWAGEGLDAAESKVFQDVPPDLSPQNPSLAQFSSFTEVLTSHLGRYAQEQMKKGIIPTDDMFQRESRRVLYDSDDPWNQTIADNMEWLSAFRNLFCGEKSAIDLRSMGVDEPVANDSRAPRQV